MKKIRLYCLPHAGAIANVYMGWKKYIHPSIEIWPIEMPGRGSRLDVPFYGSIAEAVDDVYNMIEKDIEHVPYAIYGHSMGSIIGFELCHKLEQQNCNPPIHAFFSGRNAPHISSGEDKKIYNLQDKEFVAEILKLGGTSLKVFEHEELKGLFLPIIRNDYKICEEYVYADKGKLNCNISILYGKDDDMTADEINQWKQHAKNECKIYEFAGGHFFINDYTENVVRIINNSLAEFD